MDNFGFWDLMWTIIVVYALFVVIMILVSIVADLFRDTELSGVAKAGWLLLLLVFPLLGILIYVIARHSGMVERAAKQQEAVKREFDSYVKDVAGTGGPGPPAPAVRGSGGSG